MRGAVEAEADWLYHPRRWHCRAKNHALHALVAPRIIQFSPGPLDFEAVLFRQKIVFECRLKQRRFVLLFFITGFNCSAQRTRVSPVEGFGETGPDTAVLAVLDDHSDPRGCLQYRPMAPNDLEESQHAKRCSNTRSHPFQ